MDGPDRERLAVDVRHARKRLGTVDALRDVSLSVPRGTIFGFLGPNGAGKTTLLRALVGMIRLDGGTASLLGMDPWRDGVRLHAQIGYLPSGAPSYARMRGVDALAYTASLASDASTATVLQAEILDALALTRAELQRPIRDYSKGMRQKLAITQAMQHDPQLLLLDEPSEGLDPLVQHGFSDLLRARADAGRTVVFSSHVLAEVEAMCEQVAIIRQGELVVESDLESLRAQRPRIVRLRVRDAAQLESLDDSFTRGPDDHAGRIVYEVTSSPDSIVAALAAVELDDLLIEEPSLEDVFRSYYSGNPPEQTA
jgi:ABC-2 type transport system ATP-binding protein